MEYKKSIGIIGHRNENISGTNLLLVPLLLVPLKIGGRGGGGGAGGRRGGHIILR